MLRFFGTSSNKKATSSSLFKCLEIPICWQSHTIWFLIGKVLKLEKISHETTHQLWNCCVFWFNLSKATSSFPAETFKRDLVVVNDIPTKNCLHTGKFTWCRTGADVIHAYLQLATLVKLFPCVASSQLGQSCVAIVFLNQFSAKTTLPLIIFFASAQKS